VQFQCLPGRDSWQPFICVEQSTAWPHMHVLYASEPPMLNNVINNRVTSATADRDHLSRSV